MSYLIKTVAVNGTELAFLQAFIAAITAADGITCTTNDLVTQFSDTSNTPSFALSVGGMDTLTFTRSEALSSSTNSYKVASANHTTGTYEHYLTFASGYLDYDDVGTRKWKVMAVGKGTAIYLSFANSDGTVTPPYGYKWFFAGNGTKKGTAYRSTSDCLPIANSFYASGLESYKKTDRINYRYNVNNPNSLETIHNKVFLDTDSVNLEFTAQNLWDCSTVTPYTSMVIGGKNYYSLDAHTLLEV